MSGEILLSCDAVTKGFGGRPLFEKISLGIHAQDRIGLIGPNGAGKTTLLRILAGWEEPDTGTRALRRGVRVGYVPQEPEFARGVTVAAVLDDALAAGRVPEGERIGYRNAMLGRARLLDPEASVATLSGGWKKRLAIARELVSKPDLLLLDEPTNHLDVEGILWLEALLASERMAYLAVSHDRWFLEHVTRRVIELDRAYPDGVFEAEGSYSEFLMRRDELRAREEEYRATLANKVRREIEWLRRGAKARTTKAEARIQEAGRLIDTLGAAEDRAATKRVGIELGAEARRSKRLLVATDLAKELGGRPVLEGLGFVLSPGTRLGVLGPNGSGKTTLLRLLAQELAPDRGRIERLDGLRVVYFEQDRASLDPSTTLRRALAPHGDGVIFRGESIHVLGWARRFLFRPAQLDMRVGSLSGGERARVQLARLMLEPADVLLMDEPTNDLDIPTLEVLEEALVELPGALILVTHDRFLLERVSTTILALSPDGRGESFADYAQWERARRELGAGADGARPVRAAGPATVAPAAAKRMSYHEKREWEGIEAAIEAAEAEVSRLDRAVHDPAVAADAALLRERWQMLEAARAEAARLWTRWAELEARRD